MENISIAKNLFPYSADLVVEKLAPDVKAIDEPMVHGVLQSLVKLGIWINIVILALYHFKNPLVAFRKAKQLKKLRNDFRGNHSVIKYARTGGKYYFTFNAPGWPSTSFNKYVLNNIKRIDETNHETILDTLIFGITKKCGYQCEHCFEWDALNKPETLSMENIMSVIASFQQVGISQVQLSGGEPLNRFDDIIYLLQNIKKGTDTWVYTSGYHFTEARAVALKTNGCTGIVVSLDHWIPELHNKFRGKKNAFYWAEKAISNARENGLVACLSICATKDFITQSNLVQYAELAKRWGVSFIQVVEPRAVGHYLGKDTSLSDAQVALLEDFFLAYNYDKENKKYPSIIYHSFYSRRIACGGGGNHYVYVDTDGDVHNCPFCQKKMFSALDGKLADNLRTMKASGCKAFTNNSSKL